MAARTVALVHRETGKGLPLVLLHGYPHDATLWEPQLETLAAHARVLAPDLRGFGASRPGPGAARIEDYAADVKALLDSLSIPKAVVCGLSMGGYVALAMAAHHPEALAGLVLVSTRAGADAQAARDARETNATKALTEGTAAVAEPMVAKMLSPATAQRAPALVEKVRAMMMRQPKEGVAQALRAMASRPDRTPLLSGIRVPTLVIHGQEDKLIPPAEAEAMANAIPGSRLVLVPGAAHLPNLEAPTLFDREVRSFLSRAPPRLTAARPGKT